MATDAEYWRVKAKCMQCSLHFLLCTWSPEQHSASTLHCPECGQHAGNFMVWREQAPGYIFETVPGKHDEWLEMPRIAGRRPWWQFWRR